LPAAIHVSGGKVWYQHGKFIRAEEL